MQSPLFAKTTFVSLIFLVFFINSAGAEIFNLNTPQSIIEDSKELKLDKNEVTLDISNDFKAEIQIKIQESGISSFDPNKISGKCGDFCTLSSDNTGKLAIVLDKNSSFSITNDLRQITITYNADADTVYKANVSVKIPKRISNIEFDSKKLTLVKGQELTPPQLTFKVDNKDKEADGKDLVQTIEVDSSFKEISGTPNKYKADKVATTKLTYKYKNIVIAEIPVEIISAIGSIERKINEEIIMTENSPKVIDLTVKDLGNNAIKDFSNRIDCSVEKNIKNYVSVKIKGNTIDLASDPVGGETQKDKIICKVKNPAGDDKKDDLLTFSVSIIPKKGYMTIDNPSGSNVLLPNGTLTFLTNLFTLGGAPQTGGIEYSLADRDDSQWVSLSKQGQKLLVTWVDLPTLDTETGKPIGKRPQFVRINVKANIENGSAQIFETITVHLASVVRFASIKVKLQPMDERTVTDLYGKPTSNEYHVLMVRLFNDLNSKEPGQIRGESILAYSSSIEIAVNLEKQYDKGANAGGLGSFSKEQMKQLENDRNQKLFDDYQKNLKNLDDLYTEVLSEFNRIMKDAIQKDTKAQALEVIFLQDQNNKEKREAAERARNDVDLLYQQAYSLSDKLKNLYRMNALSTPKIPTPDLPILDGKWYPASPNDLMQASMSEGDILSNLEEDEEDNIVSLKDGEPNCVGTITYKPFTFEMMVNTVDRRAERSVRARIFKVMNALALGGSAVTAVAVPSGGNDTVLGFEKFGNFLIPGLEKLFPGMKEQYRQNIVSQTMKPIEEIPFGSDITRVLFIPKQPIRGLITANKARISQICPYYFKIKVAVISKSGEVKLGNQQIR